MPIRPTKRWQHVWTACWRHQPDDHCTSAVQNAPACMLLLRLLHGLLMLPNVSSHIAQGDICSLSVFYLTTTASTSFTAALRADLRVSSIFRKYVKLQLVKMLTSPDNMQSILAGFRGSRHIAEPVCIFLTSVATPASILSRHHHHRDVSQTECRCTNGSAGNARVWLSG